LLSFAVKHLVEEQGKLNTSLKEFRKQPYSYTSKEYEARQAAQGNNIYVIEVIVESNQRIYRLGYRYKAQECFEKAGGELWKDRFKYKNTTKYGIPVEGAYFDNPVVIKNAGFTEWYKGESLGMAVIPSVYVDILEEIISNPANGAKKF
jgi:hypothetical protein